MFYPNSLNHLNFVYLILTLNYKSTIAKHYKKKLLKIICLLFRANGNIYYYAMSQTDKMVI